MWLVTQPTRRCTNRPCLAIVEHVLRRGSCRLQQVALPVVCSIARGRRRKIVQRMNSGCLGVRWLRRAIGVGASHQLRWYHWSRPSTQLTSLPGALYHQAGCVHWGRTAPCRRCDPSGTERPPHAPSAVRSRSGSLESRIRSLSAGRGAAEHNGVNRADAGTGEHGVGRLGIIGRRCRPGRLSVRCAPSTR